MNPTKIEHRKFPAQVNAVALLLCTASELNRKWTTCTNEQLDVVIQEQLDALPFSSEVKEIARDAMKRLVDRRSDFQMIAELLRLRLWSGEEIPHPGPQTARMIVEQMKTLPDE